MHLDLNKYVVSLLTYLYELGHGIIGIDEFMQKIQALRISFRNSYGSSLAMMPLACLPVERALMMADALIPTDDLETGATPADRARLLFHHYWQIFVVGSKPYYVQEGQVFGKGHFEIPKEELPDPVQHLLTLVDQHLSNTTVLDSVIIQELHKIFTKINKDALTLVDYLCMEALRALLPWLEYSIVDERELAFYETKEWICPADRYERFMRWIRKITGEELFIMQLIYCNHLIIVRISDWS
jgi:hypothetical protein